MSVSTIAARDRRTAVFFGLGLLIASYLLFSMRSMLNPVEPGDLVSVKRLITTSVGAAMFLVVVRRAGRPAAGNGAGRLMTLALLCAASAALVLATRVGYDLFVDQRTEDVLARNVRWLIAWLGYFSAALLGYYAATIRQRAARRDAAARRRPVDSLSGFRRVAAPTLPEVPAETAELRYGEADWLSAEIRRL